MTIRCNCKTSAKDIETENTPGDGDTLIWDDDAYGGVGGWVAAPQPEPPELPDDLVYRDSGSVWATNQLVQAEGLNPYTLGAAPLRASGEFFEIENTGPNGSKITLTGDVTLPQPGVGAASVAPAPGGIPQADTEGHISWGWMYRGEYVVQSDGGAWTAGRVLESVNPLPSAPQGVRVSPLGVSGEFFEIENTGPSGAKITLEGDVTLPAQPALATYPYMADLDDHTQPDGVYLFEGSSSGSKPGLANRGYIIHYKYDANNSMQWAYSRGGNENFLRRYNSGWQPWKRLLTEDDLTS